MKRIVVPAVALIIAWVASPASGIEWESIKSANGTIKNTTTKSGKGNNKAKAGKKGNKSNYRVKPIYVEFSTQVKAFRIKYETKSAGERPNLKIELEKEVKRSNGKADWRRVAQVGRARGDGSGGTSLGAGPGKYRFVLTGQNTQYNIKVEAPAK